MEASASADPAGNEANPPRRRIQIGTQREADGERPAGQAVPRPVSEAPGQPAPQTQSPPPKITRQTPADVEAEIQAALEGVSIDDVMKQQEGQPSTSEIAPRTRMQGRVVSVHQEGESVFVDLGAQHQGVLPLKQFKPEEIPAVDAMLDLIVARFNGEEGLYDCNLPNSAQSVTDWSQVAEGMVVEARITGVNKGGLECQVNGIRGFMPASQASLYRIEDLSQLIGEKLTSRVTEVKPKKRRLIVSRRAVMEQERSEKEQELREGLRPGEERDGTVRSLTDFGAFVDIGGIDGLVHVSQLSWQRVNHPSEVLEVGQAVRVKIVKIDSKSGKISLTIRDLVANPWDDVEQKYTVGTKVQGTVSKVTEFGAFVRLEPAIEGLVHVSQIAHHRVTRVSDYLKPEQEVEAQIVSVDKKNQRIGLSVKALTQDPKAKNRPKQEDEAPEPEVSSKRRKSNETLKGGISRPSGGEAFGLKW